MKAVLNRVMILLIFLTAARSLHAGNNVPFFPGDSASTRINKKAFNIKEQLNAFYPLQQGAIYSITVCADLPVNDKPSCVFKKGEPGHVFLILSKSDTLSGMTTTRSFGFYPRVPVSSLVKKVRSEIRDNSNREYDASLQRIVTAADFDLVLNRCQALAAKKYNLTKYNCYDYVLEVFNALPGIEKLPITRVKFPFIFGKGGSPCALYSDFKKLVSSGSSWSASIKFGSFRSPPAEPDQHLTAQF